MHEMQTILINVRGVGLSVCLLRSANWWWCLQCTPHAVCVGSLVAVLALYAACCVCGVIGGGAYTVHRVLCVWGHWWRCLHCTPRAVCVGSLVAVLALYAACCVCGVIGGGACTVRRVLCVWGHWCSLCQSTLTTC